MKKILLIVLILFAGKSSFSQRCGDGIVFTIADSSGKLYDSTQLRIEGSLCDSYYREKNSKVKSNFDFKYDPFYQTKPDTVYITDIKGPGNSYWWDAQRFYVRSYCGMILMRIKVFINEDRRPMILDIYNIPGDIPFKTDKVTFAPGHYEINIGGYVDYKRFKTDTDGYYVIKSDQFIKSE